MTNHTPLTLEQIEALVEEVIDANSVWPDPLPSQVDAVMDIVREAMEQAWERGNNDGLTFAAAPQKSLLTNPYTRVLPPAEGRDQGGAA